MMDYDVAVVGAGPGGYVAALHAVKLGKRVCLIERDEVGGICLNWGCIPTKALVASAKVFANIQKATEYGITVGAPAVDWTKVRERQAGVVKRLVTGVRYLLQQAQVELIRGTAQLSGVQTLVITTPDGQTSRISADRIILATGSQPLVPGLFEYDGRQVITSNEALTMAALPESLAIVGGGVVGCEFASIMASFGVKVTIIEMLENLLPFADKEISSTLRLQFKKKGVAVQTGVAVQSVRKTAAAVELTLANGQVIAAAHLLVAIGRRPNSADLGLEALGVAIAPNGRVPVNEHLQTNLPWLYAIGDLNDQPFDLAHTASFQGICAVRHLAGAAGIWTNEAIPNCIFTEPEVAAVGLTADEATAQGIEVTTAKLAFLANGKAQAQGEAVGFVKVVAEKDSGKLRGVHIIGPNASDLIAEATLAVKQGLTAVAITQTVHAHPTLAEAFLDACEMVK